MTFIKRLRKIGVGISLTGNGNLAVKGPPDKLGRWLYAIRMRKPAILRVLALEQERDLKRALDIACMGATCFDGAIFTAAMLQPQLDAQDIQDTIAGECMPQTLAAYARAIASHTRGFTIPPSTSGFDFMRRPDSASAGGRA